MTEKTLMNKLELQHEVDELKKENKVLLDTLKLVDKATKGSPRLDDAIINVVKDVIRGANRG